MKVILLILLKNISHQKIYIYIYILVLLPMKWWIPSNDSQIVGLTEVMQEILPQVPKLGGSLMNKTHEDQTQFFYRKKYTRETL